MKITKLTNPTTLPTTLNAIRDHLRIEHDEPAYNDELTSLIYTARDYVESETHLTLITTQLRATWDCWPAEIIKIPGWPVSSLDSITYTDTDGTEQTLSSLLYRTNLVQCPATVQPAIDQDWPDLQTDAIQAVNVNFTAGYGSAATDVPYMVQHLIKLLVGHWFHNREAVLTGTIAKPLELAFASLRDELRVNEFQTFLTQ